MDLDELLVQYGANDGERGAGSFSVFRQIVNYMIKHKYRYIQSN